MKNLERHCFFICKSVLPLGIETQGKTMILVLFLIVCYSLQVFKDGFDFLGGWRGIAFADATNIDVPLHLSLIKNLRLLALISVKAITVGCV